MRKQNRKGKLKKLTVQAVSLLFPPVCPLCGQILEKRQKDIEKPPFICEGCFRQLTFPVQPRCMTCSRTLEEEEEELCEECQRKRRYFDQGYGMLIHDDAARKIIYDLKFRNKRDPADFLGWAMAASFKEQLKIWNPQALIPVPLHKKRQKQRGYNQARMLAEKMAFWLCKAGMEIPVDNEILIRRVSTLPQRELNPARRIQNMHQAFAVTGEKPYKTVVLIDDIYTSGATLDECARTLKAAGVERVYFLTASIV